jgi:apolipoprotein N-acyltransferase
MKNLERWLSPWRQPAPWLALVLLVIAAISSPPRLWFWVALLLVVLLVGWVQALRPPRA